MASLATPPPAAPAAPAASIPAAPSPTPSTTSGGNGADVASDIRADFDRMFATSDAEPRSNVQDTPTSPAPMADPETTTAPAETQAPETEETAAPVETTATETETKTAEGTEKTTPPPAEFVDLPAGVTVVEKNGKKSYQIPEEHFGEFHQAYSMNLRAQEVLGQPMTEDVLQDLNRARVIQYSLENDLITPDLNAADRIFNHLMATSIEARKNGFVTHDPMAVLAEQMPDWLERNDPAAYEIQSAKIFRKVLDNAYRIGIQNNDENLLRATKWMDKINFGDFKTSEELAQEVKSRPDPREAAIEQREQALARQTFEQEEGRWKAQTNELGGKIQKNFGEIIKSTIKPIVPHYEKLQSPETVIAFERELNDLVEQNIAKDLAWKSNRNGLLRRARHTQDPRLRQELFAQVEKLSEIKCRIVLDPRRNAKVREILSKGAATVKATVDASHNRHAESAQRREPTGSGATPQRSVMPPVPQKQGLRSGSDIRDEIMKSL